jgi:hypothetical protein
MQQIIFGVFVALAILVVIGLPVQPEQIMPKFSDSVIIGAG